MAIVASATPTLRMAYTLTDTTTERAISESATVGISAQAFSDYTSGTGYAEINAGVVLTGVLGSGSGFNISTTGVNKRVFGKDIYLNFTATNAIPSSGQGIKGIQVVNSYNGPSGTGFNHMSKADLPYITVGATGLLGFSGLFGDGSGGSRVYPQSTWAATFIQGQSPVYDNSAADNTDVTLIDSGSGVPYQVMIIGVTGAVGGS